MNGNEAGEPGPWQIARLSFYRRGGTRQNPGKPPGFVSTAILGGIKDDIAYISDSSLKLQRIGSTGYQGGKFFDDEFDFSHCLKSFQAAGLTSSLS